MSEAPVDYPQTDPDGPCPDCGGKLEPHYGFFGRRGLGSMTLCRECWSTFNFRPDNG